MDVAEREVASIKALMATYEPSRANDLKLQRMNDTATRIIEDLRVVKEQVATITTDLAQQDRDSVQRDTEISATQDKLQIKVLIFILTTSVGIVVALLVNYIIHAH